MNVYFDSSALIKRYIDEDYSNDVAELISRSLIIGTSVIALAELVSAFRRAVLGLRVSEERADALRAALVQDAAAIVWFPVDRGRATLASSLAWKHGLRGFDAVHLGAGLQWSAAVGQDDLVFATFDQRLAEAARSEGLTVWP